METLIAFLENPKRALRNIIVSALVGGMSVSGLIYARQKAMEKAGEAVVRAINQMSADSASRNTR